jgi:CHAD domain-containing protein
MRAAGLGGYAATMLGQVWADCQRHGPSVSGMTPEQRHDFRKDLKTMRYLAEFFAPLFPGLSQDPFRSDFRDIQDALGTLNDWEVALALEGAPRPAVMPAKQTRAMVAAEAIWLRLCSTPLPWG